MFIDIYREPNYYELVILHNVDASKSYSVKMVYIHDNKS